MNDASDLANELSIARTVLGEQWESTSSLWNDHSQRTFGGDYIEPLDEQTGAAIRALDALGSLVAQARGQIR